MDGGDIHHQYIYGHNHSITSQYAVEHFNQQDSSLIDYDSHYNTNLYLY
jgi:hypothetical protein